MRARVAGFTLIELLVALAIIAIVAAAIAAPFARTIDSRDRAEVVMERTNAVRVTLSRIAEELEGAIMLSGPPYRFVVTDRTLDRPSSELSFATTAARRVSSGPQDPVELVHYHLEPGPVGARGGRLVKEQQPSLQQGGPPAASFVVLEDVTAFRIGVIPAVGREVLLSWTSGDGNAGGLPRAVAVELGVDDGSADPPTYRLLVALPLATEK